MLIFEEKLPNYASGLKCTPNSDSIWVRRLFNVCMRVFCAPKCDNFICLLTRQDQNVLHLKRWFFFSEIVIFCKSIVGPLSEAKTHWMVNWLQLLNQLNFVWRYIKVFFCKIRLNDVSEVFNCWERRWIDVDGASHTLYATVAIFLGVRTVFWLFTLWFIYEDASFFHFFHKIRWFFFANIGILCKLIAGPLSEALFKRIYNHIRSAEGYN